ncbi:MAG: extracellular solute-binding protein [Anaerolineales bacterium]
MTQIEFSIIPDTQDEFNVISDQLKQFQAETGIEVHTKRMSWGMAWPELMSFATQGRGSDISHIGSTWVSSLVVMNSLAPIPTEVVEQVGRMRSYLPAAWQSVKVDNSEQIWSIPLSIYTYVFAYRRDKLAELGLDETTAFSTPEEISNTVNKLYTLKEFATPWITPIAPSPFNDLIHLAASWIWSKGGEFMDQTGRRVKFHELEALQGLKEYFHIFRLNSYQQDYLGTDATIESLLKGEAAAVITDLRGFVREMKGPYSKELKDKIGIATTTNTPWCGGSNLVIWRHTKGYPEKLKAAYQLTEFLTSKRAMLDIGQKISKLPARADALDALFPSDNFVSPIVQKLNEHGKSYRSTSAWHRVEYQIGVELGNLLYKNSKMNESDFNVYMTEQITDLANRLNLSLA